MGAAAAVFGPAIAAITLGTTVRRRFAARIGRNEGFNHFGNATAAVLAGVCGQMFGPFALSTWWACSGWAASSRS